MRISSARRVVASFWLMMLMTGPAAAQTYPAKPVRVIVPFPPAGAADIVARAITQEMSKAWGAQVVVDNRAGAGGLIGAEQAARAAPDGYTLLFASASPMTVNPHLTAKPPYHPLKDFTPIILIGFSPNVLVVHPSLPVQSVKALIALAKARPGQLNYASNGVGTLSHLAAELIKFQAGINMVHVPYKGGAPAAVDLLAGQVQLSFISAPAVMPHVKSGRLRALAVTNAKRSQLLPGLPTVAESGLPGYESEGWHGLCGPARLPPAIADVLYREIAAALRIPDVASLLANGGAEPVGMPPAAFVTLIRNDIARWAKVIKATHIKPD